MKNYTCQYLAKGYGKMPLEIQADTPKAAYKEYMTRVAFQEFEVKVIGSFVRDIFMDHLSSKSMEERRKQIQEKRNQTAIKSLKFLEQKKEDGYFLLETDDKINAQAAATEQDIFKITEETIGWYLADMGSLSALEPNII